MRQSDRRNAKVQMWNRFKQIGQGLFTAGLSGALALGVLTACTRESGGQPVVTDDNLTQLSTVQDVLEQEAGNGKNYAYHWDAEDIETTMAQRDEQLQAILAQRDEWMKNAENMSPEELAAMGYDSIEQVREQYELAGKRDQELLELDREHLKEEAALDPVVSPQEAANLVGVIFEKLYGVDLSQNVLELDCRETAGDDIRHPTRVGALRPIWVVSREETADGVLFSTNSLYCTLDATTGEIISLTYSPSAQEKEERIGMQHPACYEEAGDENLYFGRWNTEDASFAPMIEAAAQNLKQLLSGGPLTGGAQVTDVSWEVKEWEVDGFEDGSSELWLSVSCDDGKKYSLKAMMPYDPFITDGAGTPYPMRGFRVWNDTYQ